MFYNQENNENFYVRDIETPLECYLNGKWEKMDIKNSHCYIQNEKRTLQKGLPIRFQRSYTYAYELLLEELTDCAFFSFVNGLKKFNYSLYHCIYCHNFLLFQPEKNASGVNFMTFDNGEVVCQVQHFFKREQGSKIDRFVFTLSTGELYSISFRE